MLDRAELKSAAKQQIAGKIGILAVCALLIFLMTNGVSMVVTSFLPNEQLDPVNPDFIASALSSVLRAAVQMAVSTIAGAAFAISTALIYLDVIDGGRPVIKDIFRGFNIFGKALVLNVLTTLLTLAWSLLLIVPGIIKGIAYSMAPYVLAENPDMTPVQAIEESKRLTKGYIGALLLLSLSFIPWLALSVITFGLGFIYVSPYMSATRANAYLELKAVQGEPQVAEA